MILKGQDDGVMIGHAIAVLGYFHDSFLEIYSLTQRFIFKGMVNYRHVAVIMNI